MQANPIIPSDTTASVFDFVRQLSTLQQQAIIRPNNPPPGVAGLLFDIPENDESTLRSDVTDHYTEDNSPIQDNVALHPEEYTVRGLVAEIASVTPTTAQVAATTNPLPLNPFYFPSFPAGTDSAAIFAKASADSEAATFASAQSLWSYYNNQAAQPPAQSKQAKVYGYMYQLWKGKQLFTVETPWGFFTDMVIMTMRAEQGEESRFKSTFTVTFKKFRVAGRATVAAGTLAGRATYMPGPVVNNGNAAQTPLTDNEKGSLLYRLTHPNG